MRRRRCVSQQMLALVDMRKQFQDSKESLANTYVEITESIMTEQQYTELLKAYTKEALASMIKADIRSRFPEPYASMYCQQFDNFKNVADFFEFAAKITRI